MERKKEWYQERKNERKKLSLTENKAKGKVRRHLNLLKLKKKESLRCLWSFSQRLRLVCCQMCEGLSSGQIFVIDSE